MTLKDKLYRILSTDSESGKIKIELVPDCVVFKAHFPEEPVTPGVCIIQMASELLEHLLGKHLMLSNVGNAKFLSIISPLEQREINYNFRKIEETDDFVKASIIIDNDNGKIFSKLSLTLKK